MPVYFIQDDSGPIKIGYSDGNPYGRLNTFKTGNPRELKLLVSIPGGREEEQALQRRFADLCIRGEWFRPEPRLLGFIEGMKYVHQEAQPEPTDDEDLDMLTPEQVQQAAGYSFVTLAMIRAGGISSSRGTPMHDVTRSSAIDCIGMLNVARAMHKSDNHVGIGARMAADAEDIEEKADDLSSFVMCGHERPKAEH